MATLTLSIKEDLIIGGKQQGTTTTKEITGVNNAYCRYYVVDNTEDTVVDFQADRSGGGAVEDGTLKYARFTHTGTSNTIDLRLQAIFCFLILSTQSPPLQVWVEILLEVSLTLLKPFAPQLTGLLLRY